MTHPRLGTFRSIALAKLYALNVVATAAICLFAESPFLSPPYQTFRAVGFADAQVSLGVSLAMLGPGAPMTRIALALGMIGAGAIANCALGKVEIQPTGVAQVGLASLIHVVAFALALAPFARNVHVGVVDLRLPPVGRLQGEASDVSNTGSPRDASWWQFGVRELLVWTLVCAILATALRLTMGDFRWDRIDWARALTLSPELWAQVGAVTILSLATLMIGLSGFGSAPLVWCTLAGLTLAWLDIAAHWFANDSTNHAYSEMILTLDLSRVVTLIANVAALRFLGLGLRAAQAPAGENGRIFR